MLTKKKTMIMLYQLSLVSILLLTLLSSCATKRGYSSIDCDQHYYYISKHMIYIERKSIVRNVYLRHLDGLEPLKYWDGLDRKRGKVKMRRL